MATATSASPAVVAVLLALAAGCERTTAAPHELAHVDPAPSAPTDAQREAELERDNAAIRAELEVARRELADALAGNCAQLASEVETLRAELAAREEARIARELEWRRYHDGLRSLELSVLPDFATELPPEQGPPVPEPPPVDPRIHERSEALERSLRALLAIEGVRGLDLFEAGELHDESGGGWIGPVLFRQLDERGRLAGSISAQRLRLEGSRAARTLTIVLEDGYESRDGARTFFPPDPNAGFDLSPIGVRRWVLDDVDPLPWVEAAPELFGERELDAPIDDGRWNLEEVRLALNTLLREDAASGYWRVKSLAGVHAGVMRDVHVEALDAAGRVERRAFADRLSVALEERGVQLVLEDGSIERGDERAPFLDGKLRLYFPRADHAAWKAAPIPGLSDPKPLRAKARSH